MSNGHIFGVRIILIYGDAFLFQLRDTKPTTVHPGKWSFVSGSIEPGESPEEAMRRECVEEIGITPDAIKYLGSSTASACFYTYLSDEDVQALVLGEGQEIKFFTPEEMEGLNMTPKLEELVTVYRNALLKLAAKEPVSAEDFGLLA